MSGLSAFPERRLSLRAPTFPVNINGLAGSIMVLRTRQAGRMHFLRLATEHWFDLLQTVDILAGLGLPATQLGRMKRRGILQITS